MSGPASFSGTVSIVLPVSSVAANTVFAFTVTAADALNNTVSSYVDPAGDSAHFALVDTSNHNTMSLTILPYQSAFNTTTSTFNTSIGTTYRFQASDNGVRTFYAILTGASTGQQIDVTDVNNANPPVPNPALSNGGITTFTQVNAFQVNPVSKLVTSIVKQTVVNPNGNASPLPAGDTNVTLSIDGNATNETFGATTTVSPSGTFATTAGNILTLVVKAEDFYGNVVANANFLDDITLSVVDTADTNARFSDDDVNFSSSFDYNFGNPDGSGIPNATGMVTLYAQLGLLQPHPVLSPTQPASATQTLTVSDPVPTFGVVASGTSQSFTVVASPPSQSAGIASSLSFTGTLTHNSANITAVSSTAGLVVGQTLSSSQAGFTTGVTITAISGTTVTMSAVYAGTSTTGVSLSSLPGYLPANSGQSVQTGQAISFSLSGIQDAFDNLSSGSPVTFTITPSPGYGGAFAFSGGSNAITVTTVNGVAA